MNLKNLSAIISAPADINVAINRNIKIVYYFKKSLTPSIKSKFKKSIYIFNFRYHSNKFIRLLRIFDFILIFFYFRKKDIFIFTDHDCEPTLMAAIFSRSYVYLDNYPLVNRDCDPVNKSFLTKIRDFPFSNLYTYSIHEQGSFLLKTYRNYIVENADNIIQLDHSDLQVAHDEDYDSGVIRIILVSDDYALKPGLEINNLMQNIKNNISNEIGNDIQFIYKPHPSETSIDKDCNEIPGWTTINSQVPIETFLRENDIILGTYSTCYRNLPNRSISIIHLIPDSILNIGRPAYKDYVMSTSCLGTNIYDMNSLIKLIGELVK